MSLLECTETVDNTLFEPNISSTLYSQLRTEYDHEKKICWYYMKPEVRPCFTPILLNDLSRFQKSVEDSLDRQGNSIRYLVVGSDISNIFNLGGDLSLFKSFIKSNNYQGLRDYGVKCIDILYTNYTNYSRDITTISLVQGDALGGGFEAALSSNVLIAERGAKMGFPEILFNLFPGMGAYSLLSRKLNGAMAERMILSGELYSSEELFDIGVVDILAEKGQGRAEVYKYIKKDTKSHNGINAMRAVKNLSHNPLTYKELLDVVEIWASAALRLSNTDIKFLDRLVSRQNHVS